MARCLPSIDANLTAGGRRVEPELLDELAPDDARAQRSRRDLQRVHRAMGSLSQLKRAIARLMLGTPPETVVELGAGDGTLLLRLARALDPPWRAVDLTLIDRHDIVSPATLRDYRSMGWHVTVRCEDALDWAAQRDAPPADLCISSLFLHHFDETQLRRLLTGIECRSKAFIACEPRRNTVAHVGSRLIGVLGANAVTRNDAVKSVAAGFAGREITAVWPDSADIWWVDEYYAKPFSHCFLAARLTARETVAAGEARAT